MDLNLFCFLGVEEELHDPARHANLLHCNKAAAHRRVKLDNAPNGSAGNKVV